MKIFLICLICIFAILILVTFLLRIKLIALLSLNKTEVYVKIGFVKLKLYTVSNKKSKESDKTESKQNAEKTSFGISSFKDFWDDNSDYIKQSLLRLKSRIVIEKFNFEYKCGFDDAAVTALMYGTVSGMFYNIYAFIDRNFKVKEMQGSIFPDFDKKEKHIELDCVLRLTLSDIIYVAIALLPILKQLKK